ncbi:metallophosphoesterase [Butyrivibrio sp. MB2005]|uniref:metallophosphoesterase n=1 Tax=Butyrivibrio sp. MB2005 TaxID=1280678 RepID=UPI00040C97BA|nr:metallophosphoesterase [Butyrivibrio sp. MB2005]
MIWLVGFIVVAILCIIGFGYMVKAVGRFGIFKNIQNKWLRRLVLIFINAAGFALPCYFMGLVNAFAIYLHVLVFTMLFGFIFGIIRKKRDKEFRYYYQGWCALVVSAVYLLVANYLCVHVWQTDYSLETDKLSENVKAVFFADSHIGTTFDGEGFAREIEKIKEKNPDIVLIPGDFVDSDTKKEDMVLACEALGSVDAKYGVWYAFGNHDKSSYGPRDFTTEDLVSELSKNGVHVMEDQVEYTGDLCIVGRADAITSDRKELYELLDGADTSKYIIVMDHEPTDYDNESKTTADLVISGHTHGGQLIPITYWGVWMGINDRTYGYERRGDVDFIVTSGISDWAVDFKTGTKSEYVMMDIGKH